MTPKAKGGARKCLVCARVDRTEIEEALVGGLTYKLASQRFGIAVGSLHRHQKNHPRGGLVKVTPLAEVPAEQGDVEDIGRQLRELIATSQRQLQSAELAGSLSQALNAIHEVRQNLVVLGQWQTKQDELAVLARPGATVDLMTTSEWIDLRTRLMIALQPFNEARIAVSRVIDNQAP